MQLKKPIVLVLAFFLLISNSGLAFNVHYCGEKIAAITSVFSNEEVCNMPVKKEQSCCKKKQITHKKCCSDKELNLKSTSEKFTFKSLSFDFNLFFFTTDFKSTFYTFQETHQNFQVAAYYCNANSPPLYKLFCQYTLYA